ncbi:helix-turn-helix domain-containing protein [Streptomyces sp. Q6]|uniref:Helix-turn-helix domain-containing protein n=1 Tax=Streptomyces citrinus TaxID=3118173 RepID=A0ACD5AI12_9ACTN
MLEVSSASVTPPPAEAVAPLMRGLDVLRILTDAENGAGTLALAELARATGLARSTVDRICATLAHLGYVRLDGRDASLAPPLMAVANACLDALRVPGLLGPLADRLADALDESVSLAVPDGDDIRFVHQVLRRRALSISFRVGDLLPGEGSAPGLVFRRGLPWAVDDQLVERGLIAVAVPVHGPDGAVVCAVSVVSHTSRHSAQGLGEAVREPLEACVREMERLLAQPAAAPREPAPAASPAGDAPVVSLARGLSVLTAFDAAHPSLSLSRIADATALPAPRPAARSSRTSTSATSPTGTARTGSPRASSAWAAPRCRVRRCRASPRPISPRCPNGSGSPWGSPCGTWTPCAAPLG